MSAVSTAVDILHLRKVFAELFSLVLRIRLGAIKKTSGGPAEG